MASDLRRFHEAQEVDYPIALNEIKNGKKKNHWMWYIFPQIKGLGRSEMAQYYGINGIQEAKDYLNDSILGTRLVEISKALLEIDNDDAWAVMGSPDDIKLRSSMTLFAIADPAEKVFKEVLNKFYHGELDPVTLKLIAFPMNDIHMHIIPDVDDGSWNLFMSLSMIEMAYKQGIRKIIATPHADAFQLVERKIVVEYAKLKSAIEKFYPEMRIYRGCEINCRIGEMDRILDLLDANIYLSLNNTKYVLAEFSSLVEAQETIACMERLLDKGWIPVIAHIERYKNLFLEKESYKKLKEMGCKFQINAYSICEEEDERIKQITRYLLDKKYADFLGTDAHRTTHRPPSVEMGLGYLYSHYEKEYVDAIVALNAEELLLLR